MISERMLREVEQRILQRIQQLEHCLTEKLERIMSEQSDIDAAVTALTGLVTDIQVQNGNLAAAVTAIQAALAALPPNVDTTALDAAVAQIAPVQSALDASVSNVSGIVPPPTV